MRIAKSKVFFTALILGFLLLLGGCGNSQADTDAATMANYVHSYSGMSFNLPADWQKKAEDNYSMRFASPDNQTVFYACWEVGGNDYYSQSAMSDRILAMLQKTDYQIELLKSVNFQPLTSAIKLTAQGQDKAGANFIIECVETNPYTGIRFYLFTIAGVNEYKELSEKTLAKIYDSFYLTKSQEDIYKLLQDGPRFDTKD